MKRITTVRGDISPGELGYTSMHEHTFLDLRIHQGYVKQWFSEPPPDKLVFRPENFPYFRTGGGLLSDGYCLTDETDYDYMVNEIKAFKELGGNSLCDCSPIGGRGDVASMRKVSEATGVNIICATGLYVTTSRPREYIGKSEDFMVFLFKNEISEGIDGTGIKPGLVKCALQTLAEDGRVHENELATFRACARIAAENGMSCHVHTAFPLNSDHFSDAVDMVINKCGINPDRILMCHMDHNITSHVSVPEYFSDPSVKKDVNTDLHERLLDKGVNLGFDTWGANIESLLLFLPDDFDRIKALVQLINKGYASQIALGHDFHSKMVSLTYGHYGLTRFPELLPTAFAMLNLPEDSMYKMTVENPARILAY